MAATATGYTTATKGGSSCGYALTNMRYVMDVCYVMDVRHVMDVRRRVACRTYDLVLAFWFH